MKISPTNYQFHIKKIIFSYRLKLLIKETWSWFFWTPWYGNENEINLWWINALGMRCLQPKEEQFFSAPSSFEVVGFNDFLEKKFLTLDKVFHITKNNITLETNLFIQIKKKYWNLRKTCFEYKTGVCRRCVIGEKLLKKNILIAR